MKQMSRDEGMNEVFFRWPTYLVGQSSSHDFARDLRSYLDVSMRFVFQAHGIPVR